jgi:hypothetical protein
MSRTQLSDAEHKIQQHRDDLQYLAESDLPISDIAELLLDATGDE